MEDTNIRYQKALAKDLVDYAGLSPKERFERLNDLKDSVKGIKELENKKLIVEILDDLSKEAELQSKTLPTQPKKQKDDDLDSLLTDIDDLDVEDVDLDSLLDDLDDLDLDDIEL